jgi:DNA-binding LacI/PurR family transcriptional regulator
MKKRVTVKDVALKAGVSYQTVSKVINGKQHVMPETEEHIWQAASELGYMPHQFARNLRTQRSRMIGYSWRPTLPDQVNHILDVFLSSMVEEAEAANYHLLPFPYRDGTAHVNDYKTLIDSGRADGFVTSSVKYRDARELSVCGLWSIGSRPGISMRGCGWHGRHAISHRVSH